MKNLSTKKMALLMLLTSGLANAAPLAFQGFCQLGDGNGHLKNIGTFNLNHAAALAGNCPHTTLQFRALNFEGKEQGYDIYIEHQRNYAGMYIDDVDGQTADTSIENVSFGSVHRLGMRIAKDTYVYCEGTLK